MTKSRTTKAFREQLAQLPPSVLQAARKAYRLWTTDPHHPSLHFNKLGESLYSARVAFNWRAADMKDGETFNWFFIGPHAEYDKLDRR